MDQGWNMIEYYISTPTVSFSFLFWWISPKAVGELSATDRPVRFQGSVGGFSSSAAAVYRHVSFFFCGAESDPAALFECLEMNRFRGNSRGFRGPKRMRSFLRCSPCVVTSGMLLDSSIEFGESWSERNSEILPCQGIIILRLSRENARVGEIISSGVGSR